jgi:hypothetical protein
MIRNLFALLIGCHVLTAGAAGMQVLSAHGEVTATGSGGAAPVKTGDILSNEFTVRTGPDGMLQLRDENGSTAMIPANSEVAFSDDGKGKLVLLAGGVSLLQSAGHRTVESAGTRLRSDGYLRLRLCGQGCAHDKGLYGKALSGEVIIEYQGGRSVLRGKSFFAEQNGKRPKVLPRTPHLLAEDNQLARASAAKTALADTINEGMEAFKQGDYAKARDRLSNARQQSPLNPVLSYYLGLSALELKDNSQALEHLQAFNKEDPEEARSKGSLQLVTLLMSNQLQEEAKLAIQQENAISTRPPEPNSIAVHPFLSLKDPAYAILAKGIAAMVISDLSQVPGLKVLERQKVQKIMDEIKLSSSGLVSQDTLVRGGRLMRAEKVVVGSFGVEK